MYEALKRIEQGLLEVAGEALAASAALRQAMTLFAVASSEDFGRYATDEDWAAMKSLINQYVHRDYYREMLEALPDSRMKHLALHAKRKRIRKKYADRLLWREERA